MAEIRKKLTDTQFRLLMDAQIKYDNAADVLKGAASALNKIRMLILDAHGVDEATPVLIDVESQELVIEEE